MASGPTTSWQIDGETMETVRDFIFLGSKITADCDCSHEIKRHLLLGRKAMTNLDSILKSRDITLPTKVHLVKAMVFSSSHVWMWKLDYKESWAPKNWSFWTVVLEKTLESPLDCKEIQTVNPKGNQSWIFIGRTDVEAEAPLLWPPDGKSWHMTLMLGKIEGKGEGEDRVRDGCMASPTQWTWVLVNSGSWCWTGRPGMLRFMGSQIVGHDWEAELNWMREIMRSKLELSFIKCKTEGSFLPATHIHKSLLYVCISIATLQIASSILLIYDICFSLSDLLHSML